MAVLYEEIIEAAIDDDGYAAISTWPPPAPGKWNKIYIWRGIPGKNGLEAALNGDLPVIVFGTKKSVVGH